MRDYVSYHETYFHKCIHDLSMQRYNLYDEQLCIPKSIIHDSDANYIAFISMLSQRPCLVMKALIFDIE